jgi:hypothetical protein
VLATIVLLTKFLTFAKMREYNEALWKKEKRTVKEIQERIKL